MNRHRQRIASLFDLPSEVFFSMYARVRGSWAMRARAISWMARLAWRSPPRLSRCRPELFPLEAGIGEVPHSMEKAASPRILSGFEPAASTILAAVTAPTHGAPTRLGYSRDTSEATSRSSSPASSSAPAHWRASSFSARPCASAGLLAASYCVRTLLGQYAAGQSI